MKKTWTGANIRIAALTIPAAAEALDVAASTASRAASLISVAIFVPLFFVLFQSRAALAARPIDAFSQWSFSNPGTASLKACQLFFTVLPNGDEGPDSEASLRARPAKRDETRLAAERSAVQTSFRQAAVDWAVGRAPLDPKKLDRARAEFESWYLRGESGPIPDRKGAEAAIAWVEAWSDARGLSGFTATSSGKAPRWLAKFDIAKNAGDIERLMDVAETVYFSSHGLLPYSPFASREKKQAAERSLIQARIALEAFRQTDPAKAAENLGFIRGASLRGRFRSQFRRYSLEIAAATGLIINYYMFDSLAPTVTIFHQNISQFAPFLLPYSNFSAHDSAAFRLRYQYAQKAFMAAFIAASLASLAEREWGDPGDDYVPSGFNRERTIAAALAVWRAEMIATTGGDEPTAQQTSDKKASLESLSNISLRRLFLPRPQSDP